MALDKKESDHYPLILRDKIIDFVLKPFKVFDEWLKKEGVERVILDGWGKRVSGSRIDCLFRDTLKNVKLEKKAWSKTDFGNIDNKINSLKVEVNKWETKAEQGGLSNADRECWIDTCRKWIAKEKLKTIMLKQKARIRCKADHNRPVMLGCHGLGGPELKKITDTEALELENIFTEAKIWEAINECGSTETTWPDEFNLGFYKKFWSIIKDDLLEATHAFWNIGEISKGCNASVSN
ncbi:uncharacterized protein [Rutidosis leptorrhynchoides]|uniref:uncharacterized protein n=1 Tax=Rutidosis leptorrhynchoides TaxID=125765 RepID=UPI003A98D4D1